MIEMMGVGGRGTEATVLLRFNNAKYKEKTGYIKSRTGASVPRPPTSKICSHMEDVARRPLSY